MKSTLKKGIILYCGGETKNVTNKFLCIPNGIIIFLCTILAVLLLHFKKTAKLRISNAKELLTP